MTGRTWNSETADRVEGKEGLSSVNYVVGELDMSRLGPDGEKVQEPIHRAAIRIRVPTRCGHCETVCSECAEQWMWDWTFRFDRTIGGRRLRGELGGPEAVARMAARAV